MQNLPAANDERPPASSITRPPSGYPHEIGEIRLSTAPPLAPMGRTVEMQIGTEADARLNPEANQNEPGQPLTRDTLCQVLKEAAAENEIPEPLFTRLIWQESRFRATAISPVGAQGIAQFMPATAAERGLENPFNPIEALPASADFLRDLTKQFGNFGLAAAAYNGGSGRVSRWLAGKGGLPKETRDYVIKVTGRTAEHWAEERARAEPHPEAVAVQDCKVQPLRAALEDLKQEAREREAARLAEAQAQAAARARETWIALFTGHWSPRKTRTVFAKLQKKYPKVLGRHAPKVEIAKATKKPTPPRTQIRLAATSRSEAEELCRRLKEAGGKCTVEKNPA